MLSRRATLALGVSGAASALAPNMFAQAAPDWAKLAVADETPPTLPPELQKEGANLPSLNDVITGYIPFGTQPPTSREAILAKRVLSSVPVGKSPIDVALYFLDVAAGKYGEELKPYTTAWPIRWNPVIVEFFTATNTTPSGDTTSWCAAFVNYCLLMAAKSKVLPLGSAEPTHSAASRSFRTWATTTTTPSAGDLVVFEDRDSKGHGHVGFFLKETPSSILVLGGNQFEGHPIRHAINRKFIAKSGAVLEFLSYRTDPQLRSA